MKAFAFADVPAPKFLFVTGEDEPPIEWEDALVTTIEEPRRNDVRSWGTDRFMHMVDLRNQLLSMARSQRPDFFLSVDSDILLHEQALAGLLEVYGQHLNCWAVGGKAYMSVLGHEYPSWGNWRSKTSLGLGFSRWDSDDVLKVDVIMGIKLMDDRAYKVPYAYHNWGEDGGWCHNVTDRGGLLYWDGRYPSKHVMEPKLLDKVDKRVGW